MIIKLAPMRLDATLSLHRTGDVLFVNGEALDFTPLAEGAMLPRSAVNNPWLASDVRRIDGRIVLTVILPHGPYAGPETLFPADIDLTEDGPVSLPDPGQTQEGTPHD